MKYQIPTEGMNCGHCEENIQREVATVPGVIKVKASVAKKMVDIEVEDGTDLKKIAEVIREAGYKPRPAVVKKKKFGLF